MALILGANESWDVALQNAKVFYPPLLVFYPLFFLEGMSGFNGLWESTFGETWFSSLFYCMKERLGRGKKLVESGVKNFSHQVTNFENF